MLGLGLLHTYLRFIQDNVLVSLYVALPNITLRRILYSILRYYISRSATENPINIFAIEAQSRAF